MTHFVCRFIFLNTNHTVLYINVIFKDVLIESILLVKNVLIFSSVADTELSVGTLEIDCLYLNPPQPNISPYLGQTI